MAAGTRKLIFTGLRVIVCVVALGWVLRSVTWYDRVTLPDGRSARVLDRDAHRMLLEYDDGRSEHVPVADAPDVQLGLKSVLRHSRKGHLLLAVLLFAPVPFLQSLRFLMMFRAQDIHLSFAECTRLCLAGNFLNFVALGSTGGDLVKAYYVCRHTDRRTEAVTTVMLDRIVGLTGLAALVGLCILLFSRDPRLAMFGSASAVFLAAVLVASTLLVSEKARRLAERVAFAILPRGVTSGSEPAGPARRGVRWFVDNMRRADQTTQRLIRHKPMVIGSLLCSMVLQLIAMVAWQAIVYALHMPWSLSRVGDYFAYLGSGCVVAAVPVTFQGIGTVEAFYKEFLTGPNATVSQVLCLAMAVRLLQLVWSLPGVLVAMTGVYRAEEPAAAAADSR